MGPTIYGTYNLLDLTPKGRDEEDLDSILWRGQSAETAMFECIQTL